MAVGGAGQVPGRAAARPRRPAGRLADGHAPPSPPLEDPQQGELVALLVEAEGYCRAAALCCRSVERTPEDLEVWLGLFDGVCARLAERVALAGLVPADSSGATAS